jgi:DNA mismatch repair protein MutL
MDPIKVLPSEVIDQIAAGEVVERPSHLVKELVENAIDAGATEVDIDFQMGGRHVRVVDDGRGIREQDLENALARHATSKIQKADDLWSVRSFGFRGEALASIASVSRLELISKPHVSSSAAKVVAEFGRVSQVETSSGNNGTVVKISDLFENVPARLKFMKSESAEGLQIKNVVRAMAMSHPDVAFRLSTKGRTEILLKKNETFLERCKSVLAVNLHSTVGEFEGVRVEIAFSGPQDVAGNSKGLWFFAQGRWIQDRSIQAAVMEAYRGLLMHGEFPIAVAKISVPDGEVDVNIHPTKSAVKFRDPSRIFRAVSRTLRSKLEQAPWMNSSTSSADDLTMSSASGGVGLGSAKVGEESVVRGRSDSQTGYTVQDFCRPYSAKSDVKVGSRSSDCHFSETPSNQSIAPRFDSVELDRVQFKKKDLSNLDTASTKSLGIGPTAISERAAWSRLEILGQAHQTYIICQDEQKLVLIDQHAAHERVAYERLMRAWRAKEVSGAIETQTLLLPLLIELEEVLIEELLKHQADLQSLGVRFEQMGPRVVSVHEMPAILKEQVLDKALKQLAEASLDRGGSFVLDEKIGDVFATMACHSVVRAGQTLSHHEMQELLLQMDEFPLSSFCPHGRPVSIEYPFSRVERDFGRLV